MYFGIAKDIITPPFNMPLACANNYFGNFELIHDDVYVRCIVMDDGENKIVMMAFDLLFHDRTLNFAMEKYANEKYNIKPSAVIIGSTHSHVAPASSGYDRNFASDEYEAFMLERAKSCLDRAMCTMFEGTIEYTSFEAFFNISRRGYRNGVFGNFADSEHKRDTEFPLLIVRDLFGDVKSVVMSYACHPVFYPSNISVSGEFPARVCQLIDAEFYGCTSLYFQSAGGDVRPMATVVDGNFTKPFPFSHVDKFAKSMAESVINQVNSKNEKFSLSVDSDAFETELFMEPQPFEFFEDKIEDCKQFGEDGLLYSNAIYIAREGGYEKMTESMILHCQTVKLSEDIYIATMGGEPTCQVKDCVKSCFVDKKVFFIGYTDCCAYIVSDFELDEGGYEAHDSHFEYCLIGPFKKGIDQKLKAGFNASLEKLK